MWSAEDEDLRIMRNEHDRWGRFTKPFYDKRYFEAKAAGNDMTNVSEQEVWDVLPDEIREWVLHLDLHLTEHDDAHARMALRAGWPAVREYLLFVISHRIEMVGDLQRANAVGARYRWLREIRNQGSKSQDGEGLMVVRDRPSTVPRYIGPIFGDELDKRIDEGLAAPADPYLNHVPPTTAPDNSPKGEA